MTPADMQAQVIAEWRKRDYSITRTAKVLGITEDWVIYHLRDAGLILPRHGCKGHIVLAAENK